MRFRHVLIVMALFVASGLYLPFQFVAAIAAGYGGMYFLLPFIVPFYLVLRVGAAVQLPETWSGDQGTRLMIVLTFLLTWVYFILIWLAAKRFLDLLGNLRRRYRGGKSSPESA